MNIKDIKRQPNENLIDFQIRLGKNKDLYNLDWKTIATILNEETDQEYTESKWRKEIQAYLRVYDYLLDKNIVEQELEEKKREFEIAKIQYQDQKREYSKFLRLDSRIKHMRDEFIETIIKLNELKPLHWHKKNDFNYDSTKAGVVLLSDWHKGLFTINYWNEFNDEVFYSRINELTNRIVFHCKFHKVKELHVFQIGDLIHGTLHRLTRIMDTEDAIRSTMAVSEVLAEMLSVFANEFESVKLYSARGNHERVSASKEQEVSSESFNDIVHWHLKYRLEKFRNVQVVDNEYDDEIIVTDILGHTVFAVHGHRDKLSQIVSDLTLMVKKIPEYIFSGHIHKNYENEIHTVDHIVNSSLSGVDGYAKDIRKTSKAAQKLMIFDKEIGRLCTYNIVFKK